jgi:hypothetical protein
MADMVSDGTSGRGGITTILRQNFAGSDYDRVARMFCRTRTPPSGLVRAMRGKIQKGVTP